MSLSITAGTLALAPTLSTYFLGISGTPPYTYSVLAGGAGGTINASSGQYTAPAVTGADTIQVVDSAVSPAIVTATILIGTALELFCDIIQKEMGLAIGQIYLWDQKINIPIDSRLYIAVGVHNCKPFGNSNVIDGSGAGLQSIQSTNFGAMLSIDILSRGPDARDRKEEVIMALKSTYAEQQQELNSFFIGTISTAFNNLSGIDGAAIPYRFNISVMIQYFVKKVKAIGYYDTFSDASIITNP